MKIGVIDHIDCAHSLPGHSKCGTPHGHTYKVECVIEGEPQDGMIMDFSELKRAIHGVLERYDHQSWNDFLRYPSVENICSLLHKELSEAVPMKCSLRVWEGDGKWAEI